MIKTILISDPKLDIVKLRTLSMTSKDIIQMTSSIMEDVAKHGENALLNYTKKFDGVQLDSVKVTNDEINQAYQRVSKEQVRAIEETKKRLEKSELAIIRPLKNIVVPFEGVKIQRRVQPICSVGCYIPGGKARYPSTVIMCTIPAKVAGVKRIVAISPPLKDGTIDPLTLVAADICGVDEFYKVGGAQGIAALTFGTESIEKVDKIVGPGGIYVTLAKSIASQTVSIDMLAGPTELIVLADEIADPKLVALDLVSQAEHSYDTFCGLVTTSRQFAERVRNTIQSLLSNNVITARVEIVKKSLEENGFIAICENQELAIQTINEIAPEHLEIITKDSHMISKKITSAGLILIGKYSASSASDYCLGSNHVLPTLGFGKSRGSLSVLDFVRLVNTVQVNKKGLENAEPFIKEIALAEGLINHYEAVRGRLEKK